MIIFDPKAIQSMTAKTALTAQGIVRLLIIYVSYDVRQVPIRKFMSCDSL